MPKSKLPAAHRLSEHLPVPQAKLVKAEPQHAEDWHLMGVEALQQKKFDVAANAIGKALAITPQNAVYYANLGSALIGLKHFATGIACFDKAFALDSARVEALVNCGAAYIQINQMQIAVQYFNQAIAIKPNYAEAYYNRGIAEKAMGRLAKAIDSYNLAITHHPKFSAAYYNRGAVLKESNQLSAAIASYEQALRLGYNAAQLNLAIALLMNGEFERGWPLYEARFQHLHLTGPQRDYGRPRWNGQESLRGKTLLLTAEQGLGDTIQFCRYAPRVAALGARVIMEVPQTLRRSLEGLSGVSAWQIEHTPLPEFDYYCPLLSLPWLLQTRLHNIPAAPAYLYAASDKLEQWAERLRNDSDVLRIGIAWSGRAQHKNDHNRSMALAELLTAVSPEVPHVPARKIELISLQQEVRTTDEATLFQRPDIRHFGADLHDMSDTAALCALVDVVVSIDTSVAHLAAALGRPTHVLLPFSPDWRWLLHRRDSPWYPTITLHRQTAVGDWSHALASVREALFKR